MALWYPLFSRQIPESLIESLRSDHSRRPFDVLILEHGYTGIRGPTLPGATVIIDEHNIESRYAEATGQASPREYTRLRRWERLAWQGATLVTAVIGWARSRPACA